MKIYWKQLIVNLIISLGVGGLSALLTKGSMNTYKELVQPWLAPPSELFPVVWTILFILMGISAYLISTAKAPKKEKQAALTVYGVQLAFNFAWSIIFFNMKAYLFAFIWLIVLWILILSMIVLFSKISKLSAYLQVPYLLWVTFAGYLNLMIFILNR